MQKTMIAACDTCDQPNRTIETSCVYCTDLLVHNNVSDIADEQYRVLLKERYRAMVEDGGLNEKTEVIESLFDVRVQELNRKFFYHLLSEHGLLNHSKKHLLISLSIDHAADNKGSRFRNLETSFHNHAALMTPET